MLGVGVGGSEGTAHGGQRIEVVRVGVGGCGDRGYLG